VAVGKPRENLGLSTIRIDWPAPLSLRSTFQISLRMIGARPSVASSRINSSGLVMSARAIASICCSPPESWPPIWALRSRIQGNRSRIASVVQPILPFERLAEVAVRFSHTVRLGKMQRPSGTKPSPSLAMRNEASPRSSRPSKLIDPPCGGVIPMIERMVVVLPMPLRPSKVTTSPRRTSKVTPKRT
jgi:hypothetical protein